MTVYRIAILTGKRSRLSACFVRHTQTITATSYRAATRKAQRLNALVIGWGQLR